MKQDAERLLAGELSYLDYAAACAAEDARCADLVSDAPYWAMLQRARDEGKKIIYVSGPAPVELIYAFDCVPMSFDLLTPRLSENAALIPPLMRACELRANADVCRLSKAQIGSILVGDMGLRPDAYVAVPIPCDSACMAYMALAARAGAPVFQFDVPKRNGERTLAYLAAQYDAFVSFLENLTGRTLDRDALPPEGGDIGVQIAALGLGRDGERRVTGIVRRINPCAFAQHEVHPHNITALCHNMDGRSPGRAVARVDERAARQFE